MKVRLSILSSNLLILSGTLVILNICPSILCIKSKLILRRLSDKVFTSVQSRFRQSPELQSFYLIQLSWLVRVDKICLPL